MAAANGAMVRVTGVEYDATVEEPSARLKLRVPMGGQFKGATTLASVRTPWLKRRLRGRYPKSEWEAKAVLGVLAPDGLIPWEAIHYEKPPKGEATHKGVDGMKVEITFNVDVGKPTAELRRDVLRALKALDDDLKLPPGKHRRSSSGKGKKGDTSTAAKEPLLWYFEEFNPKESDGRIILKVEDAYFSSSSDQAVNDVVIENESLVIEAISGVPGVKGVGNFKPAK